VAGRVLLSGKLLTQGIQTGELIMSIADHLLLEFDHEMASTRTLLERLPEAQGAWKPHPKSFSLGDLATHIARIPGYCTFIARGTELDMNPPGGPPMEKLSFTTTAALLNLFDDNVRAGRAALAGVADADMMVTWTLKLAEREVFSMPRIGVFRTMVLSHLIHHRGQLTVYARMNNVPLPAIYGPSADTPI
jgi:uncharacterized damage-inducible protein DinB